ncbi:MAG: transcription antitermination factor NusB [Halanaerobium sp.]
MDKVSRHKQRIWVLQVLFGLDIRKKLDLENAQKSYSRFIKEKGIINEKLYAEDLLSGIITELEILDAQINEYAIDWTVKRMSAVDRNILRIAVYEIQNDIPTGVAINEAVKIAKKFAEDSSPSFINGILAKFA